MAVNVIVTALYPDDPDAIFAQAVRHGEMEEAMEGLAAYKGMPDGPIQQGETYTVDVTFWGVIENKDHVIFIETLDCKNRLMQSREHSKTIQTWDHTLTVEPHKKGAKWTDNIVIEAGIQTPFIARFATHIYQYRHKSRNALEITKRLIKL